MQYEMVTSSNATLVKVVSKQTVKVVTLEVMKSLEKKREILGPRWDFERLSFKARRELVVGYLTRRVNIPVIIEPMFPSTLFNRIIRAVFKRILPRL